jgi:hypothetical protein
MQVQKQVQKQVQEKQVVLIAMLAWRVKMNGGLGIPVMITLTNIAMIRSGRPICANVALFLVICARAEVDLLKVQEKQVQEKQVQMQEKQVQMQEKQVQMQEKQVQMQEKQVQMQEKQVQMQEKQVQVQEKQVQETYQKNAAITTVMSLSAMSLRNLRSQKREETGNTHLRQASRYSASTGTKLTPLTCTKVTAMKDQATAKTRDTKVEMAKAKVKEKAMDQTQTHTQKDRVDIMHGVWTPTARTNAEIECHSMNTTRGFITQQQTLLKNAAEGGKHPTLLQITATIVYSMEILWTLRWRALCTTVTVG